MRVLALDTATEACSVALWNAETMISRFEEPGRGHAQRILPMIDELLSQAGLKLHELDALAAGVGPGAFTGVRIGVCVAQGLAFGASLPVVPINTLEALAWGALSVPGNTGRTVLACLDARMGEIYWGMFHADAQLGVVPVGALRLDTPEQASLLYGGRAEVGVGRGMKVLQARNLWPHACDAEALPHAAHMAQLALLRIAQGAGIAAADLQPVYLRNKVALTTAERAAGAP